MGERAFLIDTAIARRDVGNPKRQSAKATNAYFCSVTER